MPSTSRIAALVAPLLWLVGIGTLILVPQASHIALALIGSSVLIAVGVALIALRFVVRRIADVRSALADIQLATANLARNAQLPSSSTDWTPIRVVDAPTVAAIVGLAARVDLAAVARAGTVDYGALAEVIAVVDDENPASVVVYGAPAEALAITLATPTSGPATPRVLAVVDDDEAAGTVHRELDRLGFTDRVNTVVIELSAAGDSGGWAAGALDDVPPAALSYLAGPPWTLGSGARSAAVEHVIAGQATQSVVVPEPRRLEAQGLVQRLVDGGFRVTRESASAVVLRRGAASA